MRMKNHFHIKGRVPTLVLKQRPRGTRKWLIPSSLLNITFTSVLVGSSPRSYLFTSAIRSKYLFTLYRSVAQNLSDMRRSTLEIGAAQLRSVTEIAPKSPFLYVIRSPIQYLV